MLSFVFWKFCFYWLYTNYQILEFSYGGSDKPVNEVYFYLKSDPDKAIRIERDQVGRLFFSEMLFNVDTVTVVQKAVLGQ